MTGRPELDDVRDRTIITVIRFAADRFGSREFSA
jgi:hypothetical protein